MVRALDRKLLRDLARMKGQALTIALVVACGIASYVTMQSAYRSLLRARDDFYSETRFADVFVHLKRAPEAVAARLGDIPGVVTAETRIIEPVMIPIGDMPEPATGSLIGLRDGAEPLLDAPWLRKGRMVEPGRPDEAVLLESFAVAHKLEPGSTLPVVLNGVRRELRIVGLVLSPEFVFPISGGSNAFVANNKRFAAIWMDRRVVAPAFQMEGAFDDAVLKLRPGASEGDVIDAVDHVLLPYGGLGAVAQRRQASNFFLEGEFRQLRSFTMLAPTVFLAVAAFLVNVVLSRLIHQQRSQIATLRALGYRSREVGLHYLELVLVVVSLGSVLGTIMGVWLGRGMLGLYEDFFHFPALEFRFDARIVGTSVGLSFGAAVVGAFFAVRRVTRLAPAEAMQPEAPPTYRVSVLERLGVGTLLGSGGRMVLRELTRRPLRAALSSLGIAFGIAVVVIGAYEFDAMDLLMALEFGAAERADMRVGFTEPVDGEAVRELAHLPGVVQAEPMRIVPVRIRSAHHFRETALMGHPENASLRRIVEWPHRVVPVPPDGLLLGTAFAEILDVGIGDTVTVEVLEGDRRVRTVRVTGLANEAFGLTAHMGMHAIHSLLDEGDVVSTVLLSTDPRFGDDLDSRLKRYPRVASVTRRSELYADFREQNTETINVTTLILTLFGCTMAIGVVYNNARIALSVRSRDLASLRVLGFTRREISGVLLGELATHVLLAIGPGLLLGEALVRLVMSTVDTEAFRIPTYVTSRAYAFSVTITFVAAFVSALIVRRELDKLDLVAVLKARE